MILSVAFFAYSWTEDPHFVFPILSGAYLVEALNRIIHLPVWVNQTLFFVVNGMVWGAVVLGIWSALAKVLTRPNQPAT